MFVRGCLFQFISSARSCCANFGKLVTLCVERDFVTHTDWSRQEVARFDIPYVGRFIERFYLHMPSIMSCSLFSASYLGILVCTPSRPGPNPYQA